MGIYIFRTGILIILIWLITLIIIEVILYFVKLLSGEKVFGEIIDVSKNSVGHTQLLIDYEFKSKKHSHKFITDSNAIIFSANDKILLQVSDKGVHVLSMKVRIWNIFKRAIGIYFLIIATFQMGEYFNISVEYNLLDSVFSGFLVLGFWAISIITYEKYMRLEKMHRTRGVIIGFRFVNDFEESKTEYPVIQYKIERTGVTAEFLGERSRSKADFINKEIDILYSKEFIGIAEINDFLSQWMKFLVFFSVFIVALVYFIAGLS